MKLFKTVSLGICLLLVLLVLPSAALAAEGAEEFVYPAYKCVRCGADLSLDLDKSYPPTCSLSGLAYRQDCSCGVRYPKGVTLPALGCIPSGERYITIPVTCETDGWEYDICARCNEAFGDLIIIPALGHDFSIFVRSREADCDYSAGDSFLCSRQGCSKDFFYFKAPPLGHDYTVDSEHVEPTCTAAGYRVKTCSRCNNPKTETLSALDHAWEESGRTEASCTMPGEIRYACTRCGFARSEDIPALGSAHVWEETSRTAPTDTTPGFIEYTCSVCRATRREQLPALHPDMSMTGLLANLTTVFDMVLGWVNIAAAAVAANPVLLLCVVTGFIGTGVALFKRFLNV